MSMNENSLVGGVAAKNEVNDVFSDFGLEQFLNSMEGNDDSNQSAATSSNASNIPSSSSSFSLQEKQR